MAAANSIIPSQAPVPAGRGAATRCAAILAGMLSFCLPTVAAPQFARVNPRAVLVKSFDGWGTSLCWWAHVLGGCSNRDAYADLAFKDLRLNIVRYNIGGGEDPAYPNRMEPRARVPGFEPQPGAWDWQADANQRWFLRAAVARGVNHIVAFANSPPYWMTESGSVTGATNGSANNLRRDCEPAFAQYLVTVVRQLTDRDGVSFNLLAPMNEPAAAWWKWGGRQEGTHMSADQQARLLNLIHPLLRQNHLHTGLEATEDNDEGDTVATVKSYSAATLAKVALIASHSYSANAPAGLRRLAESTRKPLWVSEYGDGGEDGLTLARRMRDDIAGTHARAWIYWQFAEPDSNWGLVRYHWGETNPPVIFNRKFYIFSQFSRFIQPGDRIIDSGDPDSLAAYDPNHRKLVIVAVNNQAVPSDKNFDLSAFGATATQAIGHRTSNKDELFALPPVPLTSQHFTAALPPKSVTTWEIEGVVSTL